MNKTEIRVTIDNVEKQQKAIEILERYGEEIWNHKCAMKFDEAWNNLVYDEDWLISRTKDNKTEITLDQLEEILKNEKK